LSTVRPHTRRLVLRALFGGSLAVLMAGRADSQPAEPWFDVMDDDGRPVSNLRLPVELTDEIELLRGVIWTGSSDPDVTLVEFYDYNCPWCRKAAAELRTLLETMPGLRIGLVNNPILSPGSVAAAKVELALVKVHGGLAAARFHHALFDKRGMIDGPRALDVAATLGLARADVEAASQAADVAEALAVQMRLAASLGMAATPSFVMGGTGVLGYPGPRTLAKMVATVRSCGQIVC
jgi:protein-disulfide isomerase